MDQLNLNQEQQPASSKKWVVGVLIIIGFLLIIGAGVWYVLSQKEKVVVDEQAVAGDQSEKNSDEMRDWKTYKNEEYGFEFKYPSDWISGEETSDPNIISGGTEDLIFVLKTPWRDSSLKNNINYHWRVYSVKISVYRFHSVLDKSLIEWVEETQRAENNGIQKQDLIPIKKIVVGGEDAFVYEPQIGDGGSMPLMVYLKRGDMVFEVTFDDEEEEVVKKNMYSILSTFKFITP